MREVKVKDGFYSNFNIISVNAPLPDGANFDANDVVGELPLPQLVRLV